MKRILTLFFSCITLFSCSFTLETSTSNSSFYSEKVSYTSIENSTNAESSLTKETEDLEIYFLELGNKFSGDSVYIKAGETDILIDAGSRTTSSKALTSFINLHCTDNKLEYVIATHAHQDHIAGFIGSKENPGIFATYQCETIIDFPLTNQELKSSLGNDTTYGKYVNLREQEVNEGAKHYTALQCYNNLDGAKREYRVANGITLSILYNKYYEETTKNENDYSVCVLLSQNDNHFLFTGDLETDGEEALVQNNDLPHVKVFKGGHHGSSTANSDTLLKKITPENVCICTCAGTSEYTDNKENQFPAQDALNRIMVYTEKIYVTTQVDTYVSHADWAKNSGGSVKPMNGTIKVSSSIDIFEIHGSNNDLILKDTEWFKENRICVN